MFDSGDWPNAEVELRKSAPTPPRGEFPAKAVTIAFARLAAHYCAADHQDTSKRMDSSSVVNKLYAELQRHEAQIDSWSRNQKEEIQRGQRQHIDFAKEADCTFFLISTWWLVCFGHRAHLVLGVELQRESSSYIKMRKSYRP